MLICPTACGISSFSDEKKLSSLKMGSRFHCVGYTNVKGTIHLEYHVKNNEL